jgi:hypothetical protein
MGLSAAGGGFEGMADPTPIHVPQSADLFHAFPL